MDLHWQKIQTLLLESDDYCDVTLFCNDGIARAHQLILQSCSSFLRHLFMRQSENENGAVLYLPDFSLVSIHSLLSLVYRGWTTGNKHSMAVVLELLRALGMKMSGLVLTSDEGESMVRFIKMDEDVQPPSPVNSTSSDSDSGDDNKSDVVTFDVPSADEGVRTRGRRKGGGGRAKRDDREGKSTVCDICGKNFAHTGSLSTHMKIHTGIKPFSCELCEKSYSTRSYLKAHMVTHNTGERPFQCDVCDKRFARKSTLAQHRFVHREDKPHRCNICDKQFKLPALLRTHTANVHGGDKTFKCGKCDKAFLFKSTLDVHMAVHGEKQIACDVCGKLISSDKNLKIHMRTHTGERPFICSYCGKAFALKQTMQKHELVHTGQKPYPCSVCLKAFQTSVNLKTHMRYHTGEKPYHCHVCEGTFYQRTDLRRHLERVHQC